MQAPGLFDTADKRGKYGLVHNLGLGGAVVISLLRRPEFYREEVPMVGRGTFMVGVDWGADDLRGVRLGYNHAHICKPITMQDVDKVKSKNSSQYILQHAKL